MITQLDEFTYIYSTRDLSWVYPCPIIAEQELRDQVKILDTKRMMKNIHEWINRTPTNKISTWHRHIKG